MKKELIGIILVLTLVAIAFAGCTENDKEDDLNFYLSITIDSVQFNISHPRISDNYVLDDVRYTTTVWDSDDVFTPNGEPLFVLDDIPLEFKLKNRIKYFVVIQCELWNSIDQESFDFKLDDNESTIMGLMGLDKGGLRVDIDLVSDSSYITEDPEAPERYKYHLNTTGIHGNVHFIVELIEP